MATMLGGIGAGVLATLLRALLPVLRHAGQMVLEDTMEIAVHGQLEAVNFMVSVGRQQQVIQALEVDTTLTGPEKLAKASAILLAAAAGAGLTAARHEADFAAQHLLLTARKIAADAGHALVAVVMGSGLPSKPAV